MSLCKKTRISFSLLFLLVFIFFTGCSQKQDNQADNPISDNKITSGVKMVDNVQVAYLSWGKFNYEPPVIKFKAGIPARIIADTGRLQGCFRSFVAPELNLNKNFNEKENAIEFTPTKKGSYGFSCSMGMGSGTLIIE